MIASTNRGISEEQRIITEYQAGISGDFTVDFMRSISEHDVIFGGHFDYDGNAHRPDGYVQIGSIMHIIEIKTGARYDAAHNGQVNRYAHVMNIKFDFDIVVTHIVYSDRGEVVSVRDNARDIPFIYAGTRTEYAYDWRIDQRNSRTDADREAHNRKMREMSGDEREFHKARNRRYAAKARANMTPEQIQARRDQRNADLARRVAAMTDEERKVFHSRRTYVAKTPAEREANRMVGNAKRAITCAATRKVRVKADKVARKAGIIAHTIRPKTAAERRLWQSGS